MVKLRILNFIMKIFMLIRFIETVIKSFPTVFSLKFFCTLHKNQKKLILESYFIMLSIFIEKGGTKTMFKHL